eukprot:3109214-Pleurochrysis_carterae.AAC.4
MSSIDRRFGELCSRQKGARTVPSRAAAATATAARRQLLVRQAAAAAGTAPDSPWLMYLVSGFLAWFS